MPVPRANPIDRSAPTVVHQVNQRYAGVRGRIADQRDFTISIADDLLGGRITSAMLLAARRQPERLRVINRGEEVEIPVPRLSIWGILELGRP